MLRSVKGLEGYSIKAKDGNIGSVKDFFFDDQHWTIRYLVVDTGGLLPGKNVLIAPAAFYGQPDWASRTFPVIMTTEMVKNAPDVNTDRPVSRQKELEILRHYNWPVYWETSPGGPMPTIVAPTEMVTPPKKEKSEPGEPDEDTHLRSIREVTGYHIQAEDGQIGHAEDFIVEDQGWIIRYLAVDTRNWLPGKKVLVPIQWITEVDWAESKVHVDLTRENLKNYPEYDPASPVNRETEEVIYDYYGRPKYWT